MLYAITGYDRPQSLELRLKVRARHLERAQALYDEGRLLLAGPFPAIDSPEPGPAGFAGSLLVVQFPSQQEAEAWINADPYVTEGVFERVEVRPFKQVFPN
jgi:uncharacterized protein